LTASNQSTVLPDITTLSMDHTNDISLPTTAKTTETDTATGQMTNKTIQAMITRHLLSDTRVL